MTISRTAQVVALGFFAMGKRASAHFRRPSNLTEGLTELEKAGMIKITRSKRDGWLCEATDAIGWPFKDYPPIDPAKPDEMFRVMKS